MKFNSYNQEAEMGDLKVGGWGGCRIQGPLIVGLENILRMFV